MAAPAKPFERHWVPAAKWERPRRCNKCGRGARKLAWLKDANGLPLTMPLCVDCLPAAEKRMTSDDDRDLHLL